MNKRNKILIDASTLTARVDGLAVYTTSLIKALAHDWAEEFAFTVLLNPDVDWPEISESENNGLLAITRVPIAPVGPRRDWDMLHFLRTVRAEYDLVHITSNQYPLAMTGGVCTIHDVTFRRWFDRQRGIPGTGWLAVQYLDRVIRHCLSAAHSIIAVSHATKDEIARQFLPTPDELRKIKVIHEGWEHLGAASANIGHHFPFEDPGYLFFLGSHRIHKNLGTLLRAFQIAADQIPIGKSLVISGSSGQLSNEHANIIAQINARSPRVIFTGYVASEQVRRLYAGADAFIMPSLAEGFGLPILEAFNAGTPVLCSNVTSLPEIAGDAAIYFDPCDAQSIADAIVGFYRSPATAELLKRRGKLQLNKFSWNKAATETADCYRRALTR